MIMASHDIYEKKKKDVSSDANEYSLLMESLLHVCWEDIPAEFARALPVMKMNIH